MPLWLYLDRFSPVILNVIHRESHKCLIKRSWKLQPLLHNKLGNTLFGFLCLQHSKVVDRKIFWKRWSMGQKMLRTTALAVIFITKWVHSLDRMSRLLSFCFNVQIWVSICPTKSQKSLRGLERLLSNYFVLLCKRLKLLIPKHETLNSIILSLWLCHNINFSSVADCPGEKKVENSKKTKPLCSEKYIGRTLLISNSWRYLDVLYRSPIIQSRKNRLLWVLCYRELHAGPYFKRMTEQQ